MHADVIAAALAAGKHVYTEKPLATEVADALALLAEAERRRLRIGCAPDIFLGAAYQAGRAVIDEGAIGEPLSVSAAMLAGGQETWHPNPDIFYVDGAGPLFDMGPYYLTAIAALLGPIAARRRLRARRSERVRTIEIGPARRSSASSRRRPRTRRRAMQLESGVLGEPRRQLRDAGPVRLRPRDPRHPGRAGRCPTRTRSRAACGSSAGVGGGRTCRTRRAAPLDARGIGLHDMVEAIREDRPHRASGLLGAHVVEVVRGILEAASSGRTVEIESRVALPAPLPIDTPTTDVARS